VSETWFDSKPPPLAELTCFWVWDIPLWPVAWLCWPNSAAPSFDASVLPHCLSPSLDYFCQNFPKKYMFTQLRLPTGSVLAWPKSLFDTYICVRYICIFATIRLTNFTCQNWECACVDEVACSRYICFCRCCRYRVCNIYIYFHYLSIQLHLPTGSVLVWTKSLFDMYMCLIYIYMLPLFVYPTPLAYW